MGSPRDRLFLCGPRVLNPDPSPHVPIHPAPVLRSSCLRVETRYRMWVQVQEEDKDYEEGKDDDQERSTTPES